MKLQVKFQEPNPKNQSGRLLWNLALGSWNSNAVRTALCPILLAGIGCVTFPSFKDDSPPKAAQSSPKPPAANQELTTPPVNPDEITDANAREKVEALRKELSREDK